MKRFGGYPGLAARVWRPGWAVGCNQPSVRDPRSDRAKSAGLRYQLDGTGQVDLFVIDVICCIGDRDRGNRKRSVKVAAETAGDAQQLGTGLAIVRRAALGLGAYRLGPFLHRMP